MSVDLSVVIPAYNEASRLPRTLRKIVDYLSTRPGDHEIIVADDGSTDGTAETARETVSYTHLTLPTILLV